MVESLHLNWDFRNQTNHSVAMAKVRIRGILLSYVVNQSLIARGSLYEMILYYILLYRILCKKCPLSVKKRESKQPN